MRRNRTASLKTFEAALRPKERSLLGRLTTPAAIQAYLDRLPYSPGRQYRSPLSVVRDRTAHCYDGAVFAAAALNLLGNPPMIVNMFSTSRDDEHLVALYRRFGAWGAVGKSNFVGLRFREPVHRTLRELMLSYFEQYYNVAREKTFRSYTRPLHLTGFDSLSWMTDDRIMEQIAGRLSGMHRYPVLTRGMARELSPVDQRSYLAGLHGSLASGLYKP